MTDKPLHVQVAEALGWTALQFKAWYVNEDGSPAETPRWYGHAPGGWEVNGIPLNPLWKEMGERPEWVEMWPVPHYDTDWSATGPFIEKYEVCLNEDGTGYTQDEKWRAEASYYHEDGTEEYGGHWAEASVRGATPLIAVCHLILELARLGQLEKPLCELA